MNKFSSNFYTKTQKAFLNIAKNKKNYIVLNSSKNTTAVEKEIFNIIKKRLK